MSLKEVKDIILENNEDAECVVEDVKIEDGRIIIIIKEEKEFDNCIDVLNCIYGIEDNYYDELVIGNMKFEVIDYYGDIVLGVSFKSEILENIEDEIREYMYEDIELYKLVNELSSLCNIDDECFDYNLAVEQGGCRFYIKDYTGEDIDGAYLDVDFELVEVANGIEETIIRVVFIELNNSI